MAIQQCSDMLFGGTLDVAEYPSYPDGFLVDAHQTGFLRFGTTRHSPQSLWIGPPAICFSGKVAAGGTGNSSCWEIGFLQSISLATWTGHYTNGEQLQYRLNTDHGPLKDGGGNSLFFRHTGRLVKEPSSIISEAKISDSDSTQAMFWREYSGDPFRPHADPGTELGQLTRTEGEWRFQTLLAAVNQTTKSIVTLAECHWVLTWDGAYDYDARVWQPRDAETIITHREMDRAGLYENPATASAPPPFSLYLDNAKQSWEVWTPSGWVVCRDCRPNPGAPDRPSFGKWGT